MTAEANPELVSIEEYLAGEEGSDTKHEYLGGVVYAMAGGRNVNQQIATNAVGSLFGSLRGKTCRPFNSDTKVRIRQAAHTRFYYPDAMVVCDKNSANEQFQDQPVVLIEVVSPSTRRTDEFEKKEAYLTIPSLGAYLIVETDQPLVIAHRRVGQAFERQVYQGIDTIIPLPEVDAELPLSELYDGVEFDA